VLITGNWQAVPDLVGTYIFYPGQSIKLLCPQFGAPQPKLPGPVPRFAPSRSGPDRK